MVEIDILRYSLLLLRTRLRARSGDAGVGTLELVLWIGGLAGIALATIAVIAAKVGDATNNIPTGPASP